MIRGQALTRGAGKNPIIATVSEYTTRSPSTTGTPALALAITGVSPFTPVMPSIETNEPSAPTPRLALVAICCVIRLRAKAAKPTRSIPIMVRPAVCA